MFLEIILQLIMEKVNIIFKYSIIPRNITFYRLFSVTTALTLFFEEGLHRLSLLPKSFESLIKFV